jgi:hypothetical protein
MSFTRMQMRTTRPRDFCSKKWKFCPNFFFHKKLTESRLLYFCPESSQRSSKFFLNNHPIPWRYSIEKSMVLKEVFSKILLSSEKVTRNYCSVRKVVLQIFALLPISLPSAEYVCFFTFAKHQMPLRKSGFERITMS